MRIWSHRGRTPGLKENTLAAFDAVIERGVDGIETDVRLTADGVLVLHHDARLLDGRPLAAVTHEELCDVLGTPVPRLADALERHPGIDWNVEVKAVGAFPHVLRVLESCELARAPLLSSFWHAELLAQADAYHGPVGLLIGHAPAEAQLRAIVESGARAVLWYLGYTKRELVERVRTSGLLNVAWNCNTVEDLERCAAWGMDAVITDDPTLADRVRDRVE